MVEVVSRFSRSVEEEVQGRGHEQDDQSQRQRPLIPRQVSFVRLVGQGVHQPDQLLIGPGRVNRLTAIVTTKQTVQAKIAVQKFWAISLG